MLLYEFLVELATKLVRASFPLAIERTKATAIRVIDTRSAECIPITNALPKVFGNVLTPKKIANADWRDMESDAINRAIGKLVTIPVLARVRKSPDATP